MTDKMLAWCLQKNKFRSPAKNVLWLFEKSNVTQPLVTNPYPGAWPFKPFFCSFLELLMTNLFFVQLMTFKMLAWCLVFTTNKLENKFKFPAKNVLCFLMVSLKEWCSKDLYEKVLFELDKFHAKIYTNFHFFTISLMFHVST